MALKEVLATLIDDYKAFELKEKDKKGLEKRLESVIPVETTKEDLQGKILEAFRFLRDDLEIIPLFPTHDHVKRFVEQVFIGEPYTILYERMDVVEATRRVWSSSNYGGMKAPVQPAVLGLYTHVEQHGDENNRVFLVKYCSFYHGQLSTKDDQ